MNRSTGEVWGWDGGEGAGNGGVSQRLASHLLLIGLLVHVGTSYLHCLFGS